MTTVFVTLFMATMLASPAAAHERTFPLPGGTYEGSTALGKRVVLKLRTEAPAGTIRGLLRMPCAAVRAPFRTSDGHYTARQRDASGDIVFRATGKFSRLNLTDGTIDQLTGGGGSCAPAAYQAQLTDPAVQAQTVNYGPFDVAADSMQQFTRSNVARPCTGCYLLGMEPDLVYNDGSRATHDTGAHLHHMVLFNTARTDATCAGWPERFFASGDERTPVAFPKGYGYRVDSGDSRFLLTELMNMNAEPQQLNVQVRFYFLPAPAAVGPVKPVWLDIDNCGDSEYTIPAGYSDTHRDFTVPASRAGNIVAIGGHQHKDGVQISATNETAGGTICTSVAGYGTEPGMGPESMSVCAGDPLAHISTGDVIRLHSEYDSPTVQNDVMGIMLAYVNPAP